MSQLPLIHGTTSAANWDVRGAVNMNGNRSYPEPILMRVGPGGSLRLNGHTLDLPTGAFFVEGGPNPGRLIMDNAADTLSVGMHIGFLGATTLTAGTLIAKGEFVQHLTAPSAFTASGTHTTVFAGAAAQTIQMPGAAPGVGTSYFHNLKIENPAGVDVGSDDLDVRGQLMGSGAGVLKTTNNRVVHIAGGLNVAGLILDGVPLNVTGGEITRFDNVTFRNMAPYYPAQLRIRNAYTVQTMTLNNISFLVPPNTGSLWIDADDTDPSNGTLTLDIVSPQAASGPSYTSAGNAVITWRVPVVGGGGQ